MSIKISFSPDNGRLLGAQIVGYEGVDKRIDLLSSAIQRGATVYDLAEIEHAYAPPFASAKDPIAIAGYVAQNILTNKMPVVYWEDVLNVDAEKAILLDVRTEDEFSLGSIPGAINIPLDDLRDRLNELPLDKQIIVFCAIGLRGYLALNILLQRGFENSVNLSGGLKTFEAATYKIENKIGLGTPEKRNQEMDLDIQSPKPIKKMLK